jgi:predicted nucleic-acid-binding protein
VIALDTNILVRYLVQDDAVLSPRATDFIENELSAIQPGFISTPVLCELIWTLRSSYGRSVPQIRTILGKILTTDRFVIDGEAVVKQALELSADPADAIIHQLGRARGCRKTLTFDRSFARLDGVELLA